MWFIRIVLFSTFVFVTNALALDAFPPDYQKKRVLISTDIGGGDPDDKQSMIHFLAYADKFDLEGIVISRPRGRIEGMLEVLKAYEKDYNAYFSFISADFPTPQSIRSLIKVGAKRNKKSPPQGYSNSTPGSRQIVKAAKKDDPRPLYVLVWGSLTDVAQALHDDSSIGPKLRIFSISNPKNPNGYNVAMDPSPWRYMNAYHAEHLYWIESYDTFKGIYNTRQGDKSKYGNVGFVSQVIKNRGALGKLFYKISATINVNRYGIKMGDTPSFLFAMNGSFENPSLPSWGGQYCRDFNNYYTGCDKYPQSTVSQHRTDILKDWESRLIWLYDWKN